MEVVNMNLLLGNGINLINDNNKFSANSISKRVKLSIELAIEYFSMTVNTFYLDELKDCIDFDNYDKNIEQLFFDIYKEVIIKERFDYFIPLYERRLIEFIDTIKRVLINSIFIESGNFIEIKIPKKIVDKIYTFKNIYTMNYFEYWDKENKAVYLHGKLKYQEYNRNDFTIDQLKYENDVDYNEAVDKDLGYHMFFPIENTDDLIMAPSTRFIDKQKLKDIDRSYKKLGPFLFKNINLNKTKLYEELENIEEISIFGLSPFGDDILMNKLNKIPKIKIYVYNLKNNFKEVNKWKIELPHAKLIDSSEFTLN